MSAVEKKETPAIGQAYGGGFVTGITRDPDTGVRCLHITAGAEHELVGAWGEYGVKIEGADSFTNSRANTEAMAAAGSGLAKKVLALEIGGYIDWAVPARDVQELQYRHFKPTTEQNWQYGRSGDNPNSEPAGLLYAEEDPAQTAHEAFIEGSTEAFRDAAYWSSSQRSANFAFGLHFEVGDQDLFDKFLELRVRPVRSEVIQ
ncbi:Lcl C-terminal domain-containing protein [Pseudomonas sichuanensis]